MDGQKTINHLQLIARLAEVAQGYLRNGDSKGCWSTLDLLSGEFDSALAELGERKA